MARANIVEVQDGPGVVAPAGTALTVADGGQFRPDGSDILWLTASADATVTIPSAVEFMDPVTVNLSAGETRPVGADAFHTQPDGMAHVNVSADGVTAIVLRGLSWEMMPGSEVIVSEAP